MTPTILEKKLEAIRTIGNVINSVSKVLDRDNVTAYASQKLAEELGKEALLIVKTLEFDDNKTTYSPSTPTASPIVFKDVPF